jgi:predicted alpha/beta-fold hydrolase
LLTNGHLQTVLPGIIRKVKPVAYRRERIGTPDGDFLDLDWVKNGAARVAVLSHGLEGDSKRHYMLGMANALLKRGWDVVAWNARGCSGEPNRMLRFTHSGATEDLGAVVAHVLSTSDYSAVALIGFSLGGNLTLKYTGERGTRLDTRVKAAVAFSVPCDLESSSLKLAARVNRIYMRRFLTSLHCKIRAMKLVTPQKIDDSGYRHMRTFKHFDDRYTAPIHGFMNAEDYWRQCSCKSFLRQIQVPTLLVNARNDPFLSEACFPVEEAETNPNFCLETPANGGHVGFISFNRDGEYWSETRAAAFLEA